MLVVDLLFGVLFYYLAFAVLYLLVFALAGRWGKLPEAPSAEYKGRMAVFIPSYKEDAVILHTAREALMQVYPHDRYHVVVIADSLQPETIATLRKLPITVVEVQFEKSTKAKSLNKALEALDDSFDYAVILDADNIMASDCLLQLNHVLQAGAKAVQGHRTAKNLDTRFAILDAISEEVNNHIFRLGHRVMSLSAALIGSGMAFDYAYFKQVMAGIHAIGGFDKEMELKLLRDRVRIDYAPKAVVYDEKVQKAEVFGNQRRRWLSAQVHYFQTYFWSGLRHLLRHGNVDYFDKVIQMVQPPRVLLLGLLFLLTVLTWFVPIYPGFGSWLGLLLLNMATLVLAVPRRFYNRQTLKAVLSLPKAFAVMFLTLFKLKGANKKFIHTPHSSTGVSTPKPPES